MDSKISNHAMIKQLQMMIRCSRLNYFRSEKLYDSIETIKETGYDLIKEIEELLKPKQPNHVHQIVNIYNININNINIRKGYIYIY